MADSGLGGAGSRSGRSRPCLVRIPHSPVIDEVTEDSSPTSVSRKFADHPRIQASEYSGLLQPGGQHQQHNRPWYGASREAAKYKKSKKWIPNGRDDLSIDSSWSASDEMSSNSSGMMSSWWQMSGRQKTVFFMIMLSSLSSSFTVCLFPPFFPRLAEMKGAIATEYGLIIGTNCLVAFLATPFIGNNLGFIGVKFAFCYGTFAGGFCCALSGFLEMFQADNTFIVCAVLIRIVHAVANAMVITSTFSYIATDFPQSIAKVFSITRFFMNVAQLLGPLVGGLLYELGGFICPFLVMGCCQIVLAASSVLVMPPPDYDDDALCEHEHKKKKNKVSALKMLGIPTIWFSFLAFIIATVCNGFLSINLEPQVLRQFNLSPFFIGLLFGLKDGANSVASLFWGWVCDCNKKSVKPYLILSATLVAASFFLVGAGGWLGSPIPLSMPLLVVALCLNGAGIGGQQVAGVVDALHEASRAGYPDAPATHGLVAGLWSSLSGAGRFLSRGGSGFLVDLYGFAAVSSIACGLQLLVALATLLFVVMCECSLAARDAGLHWEDVAVVEQGPRRDERVVFTTNSSPSESLMTHSVYVGIPNNCSGHRMATRIANSMPPKKWSYKESGRTFSSRSLL